MDGYLVELEFRRVPAGAGDAAALVAAIVAEMAELYDGLDLNALDMGYRDGAALEDTARELGYRSARSRRARANPVMLWCLINPGVKLRIS